MYLVFRLSRHEINKVRVALVRVARVGPLLHKFTAPVCGVEVSSRLECSYARPYVCVPFRSLSMAVGCVVSQC